jgi:hypothetical protein
MSLEFKKDIPKLKIMQSGDVWIKSHNRATADALIDKCSNCVFKGNLCPGTNNRGDDVLLSPNLSRKQIRNIIANATCKPDADEASIASLR